MRDTRIPVWTLVLYRRMGLANQGILAAFPPLDLDDLRAACVYAEAHPIEVDAAIKENAEDSRAS